MNADDMTSLGWLLTSTALVFAMQVGFCCLESGFVRAKNSTSVALKNLVDFMIAGLLFWAFGSAMMFGASAGGWIGTTGWLFDAGDDGHAAAFFLFQMMFCGTAATIVSGAVAERTRFSVYIAITFICALLIYPVFGHWAWSTADGAPAGWLGQLGFLDFAGSTVVHSVGGWVALAAVLLIGPRHGVFANGREAFTGANTPMAAVGALVIWFGWFGFNGGSGLVLDASTPAILVNTTLAGCAGGAAALLAGYGMRGRSQAPDLINGCIAGLVAVTASCNIVTAAGAVAIGAGGGLACAFGVPLLRRWRIDDAVGAIPAHLFAGAWGTLAVAIFGDVAAFPNGHDRIDQFWAQAAGVGACGAFAFSVAWTILAAFRRFSPLRVSHEEEALGLNLAEHGADSALTNLIGEMERHRQLGDFDRPVTVESGSDVEPLAIQYNRVAESLARQTEALKQAIAEASAARDVADRANSAKSAFLANMTHELRTPLNAIIGFSELIARELYGPVGQPKYVEFAEDILASGRLLLSLVSDLLDHSRIEAGEFKLKETPIDLAKACRDVSRMMTHRADRHGVAVDVVASDDLPRLLADLRSTRQMLINLVSNAIKFTPAGGRVTVEARVDPEGAVILAVADTGVGMPPEDIARALEPFVQLENPMTKYHAGAGLGLGIVKALIELHGGALKVESKVDAGTRFEAVFPASRTLAHAQEQGATA